MNNDRISAWTDDELTAHEIEGLEGAFVKDPEAFVQQTRLYALIGAAMRKDVSIHDVKEAGPLNALRARLSEEPAVKLPWWRAVKFPLRDIGQSLKANWMPVAAAMVVIGGIGILYPKHRTDDITPDRVRQVAADAAAGRPTSVSASAARQKSDVLIEQYLSAHQDVSPLAVFEGGGFALMRASIQPRDNYVAE